MTKYNPVADAAIATFEAAFEAAFALDAAADYKAELENTNKLEKLNSTPDAAAAIATFEAAFALDAAYAAYKAELEKQREKTA
jgi:hypothetical protein